MHTARFWVGGSLVDGEHHAGDPGRTPRRFGNRTVSTVPLAATGTGRHASGGVVSAAGSTRPGNRCTGSLRVQQLGRKVDGSHPREFDQAGSERNRERPAVSGARRARAPIAHSGG